MGYLWDALGHAYQLLGFEEAAGGDEVFRLLVLARIVEPTSKLDSLRVVEEAGFDWPRRAPAPLTWGRRHWFSTMCPPCTSRPMPGTGRGFVVHPRRAEPDVPYVVQAWRHEHPDEQIPDGHIFTQPRPAGPKDQRRDQIIYYQDRAWRTPHGIDEQVTKAEQAVAGKTAVKRNRFTQLTGATKSVNRTLEAKARALAGLKGHVTNLPDVTAEFVIDAYHRLFHIEKSFRMSNHDLRARPIYHHKRVDRRAPDGRVRRPGRQQVNRADHRLVDQKVRAHHPPLPHHQHPGRRAHPHRRRPATRRPPRCPHPHLRPRCALI